MKAFLQNEIRLFFSRKNYLVWIVGVLAVVFAYRLYYVTQYENYAQTVLEELEENAKDITIWESEYQRQCMELWGDNSAEKFAHASLLLNAWKQYEQTNIRLRYYWEQAWDENGIRRTVLEEDENLIARNWERKWSIRAYSEGVLLIGEHVCCYIKHISRAEQRNRSVRLCLRLHGYGKRLFLETVYYF